VVGYKGIEAIRLIVSAGITALGTLDASHNPWIPAVIGAASVFATHVIPSMSQKGTIMTTPTGSELMGLVKPVETAIEPVITPAETAVQAVETAVRTPDTETVETAVEEAVPAVEAAVKAAPHVALTLRNAAADLIKLAESFE
jgi:hypothetical protein